MGQTDWVAPAGGYNYAYQLIEQIRNLNEGLFLERQGYKVGEREATDFCIGAAIYPEHPTRKRDLSFRK
jgi:methylenetetrahydrofolate reductase (NADPH)